MAAEEFSDTEVGEFYDPIPPPAGKPWSPLAGKPRQMVTEDTEAQAGGHGDGRSNCQAILMTTSGWADQHGAGLPGF